MEAFRSLMEVADRLNGPDGCPWDIKQTFFSLQPYLLEEAHEVIEAVDLQDDRKILEELGDLLYIIIFYGKVAEREGRFTLDGVLTTICEKLIRRHPHVFGGVVAENTEEIVKNWERIKQEEKGKGEFSSQMDGIPQKLPLLPKGQKMVKKMMRAHFPKLSKKQGREHPSEEKLGEQFMDLLVAAEENQIDVESVLRRTLGQWEKEFRAWEKQ